MTAFQSKQFHRWLHKADLYYRHYNQIMESYLAGSSLPFASLACLEQRKMMFNRAVDMANKYHGKEILRHIP